MKVARTLRRLAPPILIGAGGAALAWVGTFVQILLLGYTLWGWLALIGTLVSVGALAWAQTELGRSKREKNRGH